jgi:excisionase family DNA binding protein
MDKILLTATETAEVLGLGRTKVYALIASGELPSVRIGASVRVAVEELKDWLRERASHSAHQERVSGNTSLP